MSDAPDDDNLTPSQHTAILALLTEPTVRQAARVASVDERTIYRWLKQSDFAAAYRDARREATQQAIARLQQYSGAAAGALISLLAASNPAAIRLAAAGRILDLALRTVEFEDLRDEIEALKVQLQSEQQHDSPEL